MTTEEFFAILKDGAWHNVNQIADQLEIQTGKLIELSQFLSEKGIVKYEAETRRIKIEPEWKSLLPIEGKPSAHTPNHSRSIQNSAKNNNQP